MQPMPNPELEVPTHHNKLMTVISAAAVGAISLLAMASPAEADHCNPGASHGGPRRDGTGPSCVSDKYLNPTTPPTTRSTPTTKASTAAPTTARPRSTTATTQRPTTQRPTTATKAKVTVTTAAAEVVAPLTTELPTTTSSTVAAVVEAIPASTSTSLAEVVTRDTGNLAGAVLANTTSGEVLSPNRTNNTDPRGPLAAGVVLALGLGGFAVVKHHKNRVEQVHSSVFK